MSVRIIVDDREKAIIDQLAYHKNISVDVKRITVGDFIIMNDDKPLICIERKTWKDLAASFRDGRKENVNKLIEFRKDTNCTLVYLIEGNAYPSETQKYSRIPAKCLIAHLDHLMLRDKIQICYSKDVEYSAVRITQLARNASTLIDSKKVKKVSENDICKKRESTVNYQQQLLQCLPGIGFITSNVLITNNIYFIDLYNMLCADTQLSQLTYPSGKQLGHAKAKKIIRGIKKFNKKTAIKILSTVPSISRKTATKLLTDNTFNDIITMSISTLSKLNRGKTKLGTHAATNIKKYLVEKKQH